MNKSKTIKNIAIFGVSPYSGNRGVGALAYSALYILKEMESNYTFNYFLINGSFSQKINDKLNIGEDSIDITNIKSISITSVKSLIKFLLSPSKLKDLYQYLQFDIVFNMGEGK